MAARWEDDLQGYDVDRFQGEISEDLLCSICQEVPKDPRLCQHKDHIFCFAHISQHLVQNSQTCPVCRDPLTQETLRRPTGFLKNYWERLRLKCDHHERGCPDYVRLEHLPRHAEECGYGPVMCRNEGCETEVNRRDIETHEKDLCQFRIAKCHDCKDIKVSMAEVKEDLKNKVDELAEKQDEISVKVNRMEENVNEMRRSQKEMNARQVKFESVVTQQLQRMTEMLNQLLQGGIRSEKCLQPIASVENQEIIVLGGYSSRDFTRPLKTVENFNMVLGRSTRYPDMLVARGTPASCVHNSDVFVSGGYDGNTGTGVIEVLKIDQQTLQWVEFADISHVKLSDHVAVVFQKRLYLIGGQDRISEEMSDRIYAVNLIGPSLALMMARMPQPRRHHQAELVNGKLFILGGKSINAKALDSVVAYDLDKNEFTTCPSLPQPVTAMSTVTWGKMIIVVGGEDKNGQVLNDAYMYDTETGQIQRVPSMIYRRKGCSAVIVNNVIVAFGGRNKEQGFLNSVESFTIGGDRWKELPGMIEKRCWATAVVKPHI
ncbi:kelch domain-containing protein 8B-like [Dendronephthya gigantea]|uniref:kelch domain-containing protein 8B-like n=1 Tax=Dendronephthya gigantea TaxID=151771 RepID=UPI0010691431|nr:kelch domain-containing protein 8B-like [Dendronephthya gigantea]